VVALTRQTFQALFSTPPKPSQRAKKEKPGRDFTPGRVEWDVRKRAA
jgi:hypothetical protein